MDKQLISKQIPLSSGWDVIVVGGGPAGCTAAAAASRLGAKTLVIEQTGALGGMGTQGLLPAWCPFSDGEKMIYRGLAEVVFNRASAFVPARRKSCLTARNVQGSRDLTEDCLCRVFR